MELPLVGFGTYLIKENVEEIIDYVLQTGYKHIDTVIAYKNEAAIGRIISKKYNRSGLYITSKIWPGHIAWNQPVLSYDQCIQAGYKSASNFNNYLDLLLIHAPFAFAKSLSCGLDQWKACIQLKKENITKHIGVSNFNITHLEAIRLANLPLPEYNQLELHPLCQQKELLVYMQQYNIKVIAYSSLLPLSTWRNAQPSGKLSSLPSNVLQTLKNIAYKYQITQAQVLLYWAI